jgi:hypothetical protein
LKRKGLGKNNRKMTITTPKPRGGSAAEKAAIKAQKERKKAHKEAQAKRVAELEAKFGMKFAFPVSQKK